MSEEPETITVTLTKRERAVLFDCFGVYVNQIAIRKRWPMVVRKEAINAAKIVAGKFGFDIQ